MMQSRDTCQHVREVLAAVDPEFEMVEAYRWYLEATPTERRRVHDIESWCSDQIKEVSGSGSLEAAFKHTDIKTLISFGYMAFSRRRERFSLLKALRSISVVKQLSRLEPDFFQKLLDEVRGNAAACPGFARDLQAAEEVVTQLVARLQTMAADHATSQRRKLDSIASGHSPGEIIGSILAVAAYVVVGYVYHKQSKQ